MNKTDPRNLLPRREFFTRVTALAAGSLLTTQPTISTPQPARRPTLTLTVKQVIDTILNEIPGAPFAKTVDQLRAGSLHQPVSGIVTTMFPTLEVIEKTVRLGANLIIAHETPFYNNEDQTDWLQQDDAYRYKVDLLTKHKIALWRFHDYWHAHKPDGIIMGNLMKLGWGELYDADQSRLVTLPKPMRLDAIVSLVKQKLDIPWVRVVGHEQQVCSRIYLAFGYMDSKQQIKAIQTYKPDLILSGETREWETVERVRDGLLMGEKTSLLVVSHALSEEAGMAYAAQWLAPKLTGMRISHIASGSPFRYL
ncbi:Nif3-like dinuclear metal center hexameric protein [Spirosoma luteum]|uniref:Nif3-like dinuclear metal center hexameric protein n=1 Tax=Spirosoma luteum TaxID=431553 RepID=UPI00037551F3|nr:Nif3-like dinuclear metal center hexameric protein [Spirosoma luteum]